MIRSANALLLAAAVAGSCFAQAASPQPAAPTAPDKDQAGAYYHFAMGRLYNELGQAEGSREDIDKAIENYQEALKLDPTAPVIFEELTDLYIQTGRLRDAMTQAQDMLKQNPDNLAARRMLGRIYMRIMVPNTQNGHIDENFLRQATEQYQKITEKDPKDADSWVVLGRLYLYAHNSQDAEKSFNTALKLEPENEDALSGLAMLYMDLGDTKSAIAKLKAITEKNPTERTLATLAKAYEDVQDYKDAADALKRALSMGGENSDELAGELGKDLLQSHQVDEALHLYEELAANDPQNPEYQLKLSEIYVSRGELTKARAALNKAKQAQPDSIVVRYDEAGLLEHEGKRAEAITVLKAILDDTAKHSYSEFERSNRVLFLRQLANDYQVTQQYPQAIDTFRQMTTVDPDQGADAEANIIDVYRAEKDYTEAIKEADTALKKYPKASRMLTVEHAQVLSDEGKIEPAVNELKSLLGTAAADKGDTLQDRGIYLEIAQAYEKGKHWNEMAKALNDAEKLSTSDKEKVAVYFMRGAMLERQKKFDPSETEFRKVLAIDPDYAGALNYLGYMLADRNVRLDEAYELIKKAVDLDPDNPAYLDSLGWVYYRQGKYNEAEGLLLRAIQQMPDPTVHDHLGEVYAKLGRTRDAITQWEASMAEFRKQSAADLDQEEMDKVNRKLDEAQTKLAKEK
jgi:tetratricopeptide (TPR) repeat protein